MPEDTPETLPFPPQYPYLTEAHQERIRAIGAEMRRRSMPEAMIAAGLRSTAELLRDEEAAATPRIASEPVRRFLEENSGVAVARASSEAPRRETKARDREQLLEMVTELIRVARSSHRRHEILKARRGLLALDQNHIRRALGAEGSALCGEINAWLLDAAMELDRS